MTEFRNSLLLTCPLSTASFAFERDLLIDNAWRCRKKGIYKLRYPDYSSHLDYRCSLVGYLHSHNGMDTWVFIHHFRLKTQYLEIAQSGSFFWIPDRMAWRWPNLNNIFQVYKYRKLTFCLSSGEMYTLRELIANPSSSRRISAPIIWMPKSRSRTCNKILRKADKELSASSCVT